jgi:hypothetical protein
MVFKGDELKGENFQMLDRKTEADEELIESAKPKKNVNIHIKFSDESTFFFWPTFC